MNNISHLIFKNAHHDLLMCTFHSKTRLGHPTFWDCLNTFESLEVIVYTSISLIKEFASEVTEIYFTEIASKVSQWRSRWFLWLHVQKRPFYSLFSGCKTVGSLSVSPKWGEYPEDFEHLHWHDGICLWAAVVNTSGNSPSGSHRP